MLLESKIFYCNSLHHADYMMNKTYHNSGLNHVSQSELHDILTIGDYNTVTGVMTHPQFVTLNMTKVLLVQNIRAIFISPHNNLLDYMADM